MDKQLQDGELSNRLIRLLIVEDDPADVELAVALLKRAGFPITFDRVDRRPDYQHALQRNPYDLILCDHNLRTWNGLEALEILKESGKVIPFVVVTAVLGDEAAVEYIKQGAADYVLKHRLERLPVAVRQALRDKAHRDEAARLQEQILAGKRDWELTFDSVPAPIALLNLHGEVVRANYALAKVTTKKFSEVIDRPCSQVMSCDTHFNEKCSHHQTLESGQFSRRGELVSVNGLQFECTANPLRDSAGNLSGTVIVLHDLTERRRTEHALRESELRFRTAFRASPEPMTLSRMADGCYVDVNDAFLRLAGFGREEVIGKTPRDLNTWVDLEARAEIFKDLLERRSVRDRQLDFRTSTGELRTVLVSAEAVEVSGEMCALAISVDITDRRRLEQQFLQAQKMEAVGRLAGGVAHDFNNLLTIITGYADLMLGAASPDSPERAELEEIRRAGQRASELTRQLLAFSRRQVFVPTVLDLNAVVNGMASMLRRLIGEDIELGLRLVSGLAQIKADAGQVEQVIMNMAVNSRDAMPNGGKLTIETANMEIGPEYLASHSGIEPGLYVILAVSDTGCGMDAETQAHVFEPFFTTKGLGKGTGLGLSTVYGIVKQSGGNISVYSESGRGTTFKIFFPRVNEPVAKEKETSAESAAALGTETILLVEDEPGVRAMARDVLQVRGYAVLSAEDAEEALAISSNYRSGIHLLLTDVIMPGLNGRALADHVRAQRPEIKVLFVSGYTAEAIAQHGILENGVSFLPKPFTPHDLLAKVRQVLGG